MCYPITPSVQANIDVTNRSSVDGCFGYFAKIDPKGVLYLFGY